MKISFNKQFYKKRGIILLLLVVFIITAAVGITFAKYIYADFGESIFSSKKFYFTSNLLNEKQPEYILNSDASEVKFYLGNNADSLRYSSMDIDYEIIVECDELSSTEIKPIIDIKEGTLEGNKKSTVEITLSNLLKGKTYTVTAVGKGGYRKTLTAKFKVNDSGENVFKALARDTETDAFVILSVWTTNVSGDLDVTFNTNVNNNLYGLIPDNSDENLKDVKNFNNNKYENEKITFIDKNNFKETYSSKTYRFFFDNSTDISESINVNQFDVLIKNGTDTYIAMNGTP